MDFHVRDLRGDLGRLCHAADSRHSTGRAEVIEQEAQTADPAPGGAPRKFYLTGFMGAGKSEVGQRLAARLEMQFVDLDQMVESEAGVRILRIFEESGEEEFRRLESAALVRIANRRGDCVIATGGGTATRAENVELMRSTGIVFWLDPSFEEILGRLDSSARGERPLFASEEEARTLYRSRRRAYASAGLRVEVSAGEEPTETADRICRLLSKAVSHQPAGGRHP